MLKEMQDSEQLADIIAERMNSAPQSPQPGLVQAQPQPQEARKAPNDDEEILRGLTDYDKQRLLNGTPKSVTERMMKEVLSRQPKKG